MAKVLARAQLPIKACNPPKLPRFTKSLSFFSCRNVSQDLNFSLDRKIYSFIGVEKMQHSYKIWEEVKVYESFWTKIRNLRYFWDHFWVSEIFANDFSQVVWDERYFYKRVTESFGSSSLNFNDFKLTTTIYRFYLTILVRLIQTWKRMLGRERERKVEKKEKVCLREVGLDKGWSSLRQKIYLEGWTAEVRTRGEKDCWKFRWLLRRNKPYLWKIFMTWDIWLTDVIRILSLALCRNDGRQDFMKFCRLWNPSTVAQFSLLSISRRSRG